MLVSGTVIITITWSGSALPYETFVELHWADGGVEGIDPKIAYEIDAAGFSKEYRKSLTKDGYNETTIVVYNDASRVTKVIPVSSP